MTRFRVFRRENLSELPQAAKLGPDRLRVISAVSAVLPFRVNSYVLDELIDWDDLPADPIYQLTIPQEGMLDPVDLRTMLALIEQGAPPEDVRSEAQAIQLRLNPHPGGQVDLNVPTEDGERIEGIQHKYRETVLFFPNEGQTCHAYCTYCFRWAQFVRLPGLKFACSDADVLATYLRAHPDVTDVIFTGGDPMIMREAVLRRYLEPLLAPDLAHISIRIGSKALSYWPYRFLTEPDADDLLRLFERVVDSGRHLAFMAHFSHGRELQTQAVRDAVKRILGTGAVIRTQAPLIRHVNDRADAWSDMWREQVRLGMVPYYLFVERDTGARRYFEVPLVRALEIFGDAYRQVSGLARTVKGPVMSATPGKVLIDGVADVGGEPALVLKMIQGRDPSWVNRVFFARHDEQATWLNQLRPAGGEPEFFFERLPVPAHDHNGYGSVKVKA